MMLMIKAIIFDLDGTLIDRQTAFIEGISEILHMYFTDEELITKMIEDIVEWDHRGAVERIVVFNKLKDKYKFDNVTPEQLDQDWKNKSGKVTYLYKDVKDTLKKLKTRYKIGILSNGGTKTQRRKMDSINIYDLIDYSLISSEYGVSKPEKAIFEYTCAQMRFKPEECVYVGDSYLIDVEGSKNAGLTPVFVNRTNENHPETICISQISELLNIY